MILENLKIKLNYLKQYPLLDLRLYIYLVNENNITLLRPQDSSAHSKMSQAERMVRIN